ncbi:hypothetical protein GCM10022297_13240 [Lactobacillus hamsteri]|uniref:Uncharacterized protein n=1 Tax=Lactobacillus hamsteri DSM 5661 = JCM 6256 TaxID=1423754 RepID=A0A0R1YB83_9LACO|nr:type II toxin-antitoxin system HicA family toxin [Lactobacillus hamsteri]KRM38164.1 hypothetical protein FC39_GL001404 [Lactobacillus hamsteri DSM 5661 = JCM 6256]
MPIKPEKMIKYLKQMGFVEVSRHIHKGTSHIYFKNFKTGLSTEVPMHKGKELRKGTQNKILKEAGLKHVFK